MKTKTIKSILKKKHNKWIKSIENEEVRKIAKEGTFITGGAVASLLDYGKVNDLDIYFKDTYTALKVAIYYVDMFNVNRQRPVEILHPEYSANDLTIQAPRTEVELETFKDKLLPVKTYIKSEGVAEDTSLVNASKTAKEGAEDSETETPKHLPVFVTDNAITLTGKVQLILRFVGSIHDIHTNFDFVHCTCWYDPFEDELGLPQEALVSIMTKELVYTGSKYPLCSLFRMRKFINRGYSINAGQILKMVFQLQDLDLYNEAVLKEQLIGVDTTYMKWFLRELEKWKSENTDVRELNATYLSEVVDKVFSDEFV